MLLPDLDRMAVDDVATSPERIAAEIHRQLGDIPPPIPVEEIARALDIWEIRQASLTGFEGALITDAERSGGMIMVNSNSGLARRRYSLGHELGHFLCAWHKQAEEGGFACTRRDMAGWTGEDQHGRQEAEANLFAIELLAPFRLIAPQLKWLPDLGHVVSISSNLHISKAAAARRYVSLHRERLAVVFVQDGRFRYAQRGGDFPWIGFSEGEILPALPRADSGGLSDMQEVDLTDWRLQTTDGSLGAQVLVQEKEHATVLLHLEVEQLEN